MLTSIFMRMAYAQIATTKKCGDGITKRKEKKPPQKT